MKLNKVMLLCALSSICVSRAFASESPPKEEEILEDLEDDFRQNPDDIREDGKGLWIQAARDNHVLILQWLHDNEIPGADTVLGNGGTIWQIAAIKGNLGTLRWLRDYRIPGCYSLVYGHDILEISQKAGQDSVVAWLRRNGFVQLTETQKLVFHDAIKALRELFSLHKARA